MLSIVKEMGIFIVIAQAVLYFVPGETYVKYVKVLIGVMMIAKMTSPLLSLLSGEGLEEIMMQGDVFLEELEDAQGKLFMEGFEDTEGDSLWEESSGIQNESPTSAAYEEIYLGIGEEIKSKLNQYPAEGYAVKQVTVTQEGEEYEILLSVEKTMGVEEESFSEKELEAYYAEILQTGNVKVQINGQ